MASSFNKITNKDHHNPVEEEMKENEREIDNWLELGLGFSSNSSGGGGCRKQDGHDHGDGFINPVVPSVSSPIDVLINPSPLLSFSLMGTANTTTTNHSHRTREEIEVGLKLGLGLGFDENLNKKGSGSSNNSVRRSMIINGDHNEVVAAAPPSHSSNHVVDDEKMFWQHQDHHHHGLGGQGHNHDNGEYNNSNNNIDMAPSSSSSSSWAWRMRVFNDSNDYTSSLSSTMARRSSRPHHSPGLWFTLLSSTNRCGEALPQIPKAYIRVKDEDVTISMVKKYLARKLLGLSNQAQPDEIDISCMGENLPQSQTLKQVRDAVWLPRLVESVNSAALTIGNSQERSINHLMVLHYGRRCL